MPEKRQLIEKVQNVPRMNRNQPDVVYVHAAVSDKQGGNPGTSPIRMAPVPFNHKAHEKTNDSCIVCHHADLTTCNTCHTQIGDKKGQFVTAGQAMHRSAASASCVGCHEAKQQDSNCAGCHAPLAKTRKRATPHARPAT